MFFKILNSKYTGLLLILLAIGYVSFKMLGPDKQTFLPGKTTSAHHQIELACDQCHTPLGGVKQETCLDCHGDALKEASDSHSKRVFNDPSAFAMLEKINAKSCITCHAEHLDDKNNGKIVTVPDDFCFACHDDIAEDRPSHKGLAADGCAASGCHNYHDNRALYEDFVKKHLDEENIKSFSRMELAPECNNEEDSCGTTDGTIKTFYAAVVPLRNIAEINRKKAPLSATKSLIAEDQDAMIQNPDELIVKEWAKSGHAHSGVNCSSCHQVDDNNIASKTAEWKNKPSLVVCAECHKKEAENFYKGKHGMRLAAGLSPMKPELARATMKKKAHDKEQTCNSCHSTHNYNTQKAAVESCLDCHDDKHSKAYLESPHHQLWKKELSGELPAGSGVSCATCHLPRITVREKGENRILVNHNQNANLSPNSKMIRNVCMQCHGLAFSLESLADDSLMLNNYSSTSVIKHKTIEMVRNRIKK